MVIYFTNMTALFSRPLVHDSPRKVSKCFLIYSILYHIYCVLFRYLHVRLYITFISWCNYHTDSYPASATAAASREYYYTSLFFKYGDRVFAHYIQYMVSCMLALLYGHRVFARSSIRSPVCTIHLYHISVHSTKETTRTPKYISSNTIF